MAGSKHVKGLKELDAFLAQLPDRLQVNVMRGALRAGGNVFKEAVKENIPVKSGKLKSGVRVRTSSRKGVVRATVRTGGKHGYLAYWLEYGVAAHIIMPKRSKALSFGGVAFKSVHHPGLTPKPFMRPALDTRAQAALTATAQYMKARLTKEGLQGVRSVEIDK